MPIELHRMREADIEAIASADGGPWWTADRAYWAKCLAAQMRGERHALIATLDSAVAAYAYLDWASPRLAFREAGIPEIRDLRVGERYRRRGIASAIIGHFETLAIDAKCPAVGMGVGLYADYGPAQQLYVRLGFVPDGSGMTYKDEPAPPGGTVSVDDDLLIWLVKRLDPTSPARPTTGRR